MRARVMNAIAGTLALLALAGANASGRLAAPRSMVSPAAPGSRFPNLTAMPNGGVLMSWYEPRGSGMALRFATLDGSRWSEPQTVVTGDSLIVNGADVAGVRALGAGRLIAHWLWQSSRGEEAYDIRVSQSENDGRTWSAPITPHRDGTASEHGFVALLPVAEGSLAIWLDGRNMVPKAGRAPETMLRAATLDAAGQMRDELELDARTCDCCPTAATMTGEGVVVVAYRDRDASEVRDISVTRRVNGHWTPPRAAHDDGWKIAGCPVNGPALDAKGSRVALAWYTAAHDTARVYIAFSDDAGANFGPPRRVDGGNPVGRVQVAWRDDASAVVAWNESSGQGVLIRARRVAASGPIAAAVTVASLSQARGSGFPRMVSTGTALIFAWTEPGEPSRVRVARTD